MTPASNEMTADVDARVENVWVSTRVLLRRESRWSATWQRHGHHTPEVTSYGWWRRLVCQYYGYLCIHRRGARRSKLGLRNEAVEVLALDIGELERGQLVRAVSACERACAPWRACGQNVMVAMCS